MGKFEERGRAKAAARGAAPGAVPMPPQVRQVQVPQDHMVMLAAGTRALQREVAEKLASTAVALNGHQGIPTPLLAIAIGCGSAIHSITAMLAPFVEDTANPPPWFAQLLKLVEPPPAEPASGPVKDDEDIHRRAAASGIVLAR